MLGSTCGGACWPRARLLIAEATGDIWPTLLELVLGENREGMSAICSAPDALSWERTKKTTTTTTTTNWNVNDLLHSPLLEQGTRQHHRHFHQLFRHLRFQTGRTGRTRRTRQLRHFATIDLSRALNTSNTLSTTCGTGASRICTYGVCSILCSTVCRWTRACSWGSPTGSGTLTPPTKRYCVPGPALAGFCLLGAWCCSTSSSFGKTVRFAEWWSFSARATATDSRSCLAHERSRRSIRRRALDVPPAATPRAAISNEATQQGFDSQTLVRAKVATEVQLFWTEPPGVVWCGVVCVCVGGGGGEGRGRRRGYGFFVAKWANVCPDWPSQKSQ